ncbi:MAG: peptide-binding protein [Deltaproteobacteria bacterium]|nr:peptide-binding protein [Deltaproteobacteria bacterium]
MRVALILLFLFLPLTSFSSTIVIGSIGEPKRLIPMLSTDSASSDVSSLIFNGLLKYDKDLNIVGDLAESFKIEDGGKRITFYLRKNVLWQDGVEFTARDVYFTYRKLIDGTVATPYSGDFLLIKNARIIDRYTICFEYRKPFAPALSSWTMGIIPEHILKGKDLNTDIFNRHPIGTGPYKLLKWKAGQEIILVANPLYFRGRPKIDRVIYRIIPDASTMLLELFAGHIDMMSLNPMQYVYEFKEEREKFQVFTMPSPGFTYVGFNLRVKLFSDERVRKAICYAIDREKIANTILLGYGSVYDCIYSPLSFAFQKKKIYDYDPEKAKKLLKEAGFSDSNKDGYLDRDGKRFEFTILTNQGNMNRKYAAIMIQQFLRDVGIKVNIRILEWQAFLRLLESGSFDAVLLGWQLGIDPDEYALWHSSQVNGFNFVYFKDKEVDELLEEGRETFNKIRRKEIYKKINEIIMDKVPYIVLYFPYAISIVHKRFKGIKQEKAGIMYNFIEWWVPEREQVYR